jgi:UDP-N-acetylenolpyruvoylglucosamine reductase
MTEPSTPQWITELKDIETVSVQENHTIAQHTPLRVGGNVDAWIRCGSISGLRTVMGKIRQQSWRLHWPFEDWLVKDGGLNGVIIRLEDEMESIRVQDNCIEMGSSALWSSLSSIVGLHDAADELQHWSGSVGAALLQPNAAKLFEGFEIEVEWVRGRHKHRRFFDLDSPLSIPDKAIPVLVRIFNGRRTRKLKPTRSGRVFAIDKNQAPRELLTELSLHSVRLRNWKVCTHNPNFVIHTGMGNIHDLKLLQQALNQRLQPARNVKLSLRLPVIGRKAQT